MLRSPAKKMYPYVLFAMLLWGSIKIVGLQRFDDPPSCRQVCYFDEQYNIADCSGVDFREVPTSDGCQMARMLDLSYNRITSLHTNGLLGYGEVRHLDLSSNVVSAIEPRSFEGSFSVIYIHLSSNRIEILPNEGFAECSDTLQQLHLDRNELAIIESGALKHLAKLTHLFLQFNRLQSLNLTIFEDLRLLEYLYLNSNRLTSLHRSLFENLNRLQYLDLSSNDILVIGDELFSPHCQLVTFILANNRLRNIPNPSYSPCLNRLQILDIRNNNMSDASNITQYIHSTEKLFIDENPFHCDCSLEDVRVWIQAEVTSRTSSELSCIVPSSGETRLIRSLPDLCPITTTPLATSSSSSQSTQRQEDKQRSHLRTSGGVFSTKGVKSNKFAEEEDAKAAEMPTVTAEALVIEDGPLSYNGLVAIVVLAIVGFIILISVIILLVVCLCQREKNVKKMTKAILESRLTPRPLINVVHRAKNFTSPYLPTENKKWPKSSNVKTDETPLKRRPVPDESTPKDVKIDISGTNVRKRTPQSTDKMISNNSPNKITKTKNNQTTSKLDDDCLRSANDEEKKPFIRKLGKQFETMADGSQETGHHGLVGELNSSFQGKDTESINMSENHDYGKENALNQSYQEKKSENSSQKQGKNLKLAKTQGTSGEKNVGTLTESDQDIEMVNCHNNDKENSNQTKYSEHGCQNQDAKVRAREYPQESGDGKPGVLKESDRDNLNSTSSDC